MSHIMAGILIAALLLSLLVLGWAYEVYAWFTLGRALWSALRRWTARKPPREQA